MGFNCNNCKVTLAHDEVVWGPEEYYKPETATFGLTENKPWCAKCACVDENEWDGAPVTRTEYWDNHNEGDDWRAVTGHDCTNGGTEDWCDDCNPYLQ